MTISPRAKTAMSSIPKKKYLFLVCIVGDVYFWIALFAIVAGVAPVIMDASYSGPVGYSRLAAYSLIGFGVVVLIRGFQIALSNYVDDIKSGRA